MPTKFFQMLALISLAANSFAFAQDSAANFSSFQIISQRNIFNPDRYPRSAPRTYTRPRVRNNSSAPTFSLAGTMSYRKGMFAFFSGNSSDYEKALQVGGTIAGYTVTKIGLNSVEMKFDATNTVEMKVGAAMQLQGGNWLLAEPGELGQPITPANETQTSAGNSSASETTETPTPNLNAAGNDTLKKLMQQRQQEESK